MELEIKKGDTYYGFDSDLWHVIGTIKDGNEQLVVSKSWAKHKQRWTYEVKSLFLFNCMLEDLGQIDKSSGKAFVRALKRS